MLPLTPDCADGPIDYKYRIMVHILGQDHWPEGVLPVRQRRGEATRDRLLAAGARLVAERDIDALSVAEIAAAADCSVGSFYQRFRDKDAFFRTLIARYLAEGLAGNEAIFVAHAGDGDRMVGELVAGIAGRFRRHAGLIRAAIRRRLEDPSIWEPIRRSGYGAADRFVAWLAERRGGALSAAEELRVRFAFQMLYGTLNNAIVNQPGPFDIADPGMVAQLERAFRLVLQPVEEGPPVA